MPAVPVWCLSGAPPTKMTALGYQSHGPGRPHRQLQTTLPGSDGPGPAGVVDAGQLQGTESVEG